MLLDQEKPEVGDRLARFREQMPDAASFLDNVESCQDPFALRLEVDGCELEAKTEVEGRPNRAVIKLFTAPDGPMKGRVVVFFYKRSQIPFSRDRHSYGVCVMPTKGPAPEEAAEWLNFAASGFHPDARPSRLRLAFNFTVPD